MIRAPKPPHLAWCGKNQRQYVRRLHSHQMSASFHIPFEYTEHFINAFIRVGFALFFTAIAAHFPAQDTNKKTRWIFAPFLLAPIRANIHKVKDCWQYIISIFIARRCDFFRVCVCVFRWIPVSMPSVHVCSVDRLMKLEVSAVCFWQWWVQSTKGRQKKIRRSHTYSTCVRSHLATLMYPVATASSGNKAQKLD